MFANPTSSVGISQRVVATLVACALLLLSAGAYKIAHAANLVSVSDLLSTSNPGVTSAHTIKFTIPTGSDVAIGEDITITFPTGAGEFSGVDANVLVTDLAVTINGSSVTEANFSSAVNGNTESITFDSSNVAGAAGQEVVVAIADLKITNPSTSNVSYEIVVTIADGNTGKTRVAIVDTVLVTAVVDTTFDFVVDGLATSTAVYAGLATTTGSSTPTTLDFGKLVADTPEVLGQRLSVDTNADLGFVVTVESDGYFQSANGAIIDNFDDSSDVAVPGTNWSVPARDIDDEHTWGHWGLASNDTDLLAQGYYAADFTGTDFIAASTTPRVVFAHDGPADGLTQVNPSEGWANVYYKVEITPLQEAADDYNTTLTYIATPTF